jgi:hypothetical protein
MTWTELPFSRYAGFTLPQVLFKDPGWFFWAHTRPLHGDVAYEVGVLYPKATRIRVPGTEKLLVEYVTDPRGGGLAVVQLVPEAVNGDGGGSRSFTRPYIDLSIPSQLAHYDKTGGRVIVNFLKETYFGSTSYKMTRERCAAFFDDPRNFVQVSVPAAPQR